MDTSVLEEQMAQWSSRFKQLAPVFLLVVVLCTVALSVHLVVSPPTFNTDLGDFAPDSEARDAHDRIHEYFPNEARPMFVHVTADDGSIFFL